MSDGWSSFLNSTPYGGYFDSGKKNQDSASNSLGDERSAYTGVTPPSFTPVQQHTAAQQTAAPTLQGPSAYDSIASNPAYTKAQRQQMDALSSLSANGGRSAASDANLADIEQRTNANAAGQRGAIMQQAAARGQSGSGNSLLAALSAQQGDISNENANDMTVAGQQAQTALQAGQGAASIGAGLRGQDFQESATKAAADDAVNKNNAAALTHASEFNAGQGNQENEFNAGQGNQIESLNNYTMPQAAYGDALQRANGISGADQNSVKWNTTQGDKAAKKQSGMWNGTMGALGDTETGSGIMDSFASLASGGIVKPFKMPPAPGLGAMSHTAVSNPSNKEAMLSAIQNMRKKAMGARV